MDLHEFINYGGTLKMATSVIKTNELDVNKYHKHNGLAKLNYDYNDLFHFYCFLIYSNIV